MSNRKTEAVIEIPPRQFRTVKCYGAQVLVRNDSETKTVYVRSKRRSFVVSQRPLATYGNPNFQDQT